MAKKTQSKTNANTALTSTTVVKASDSSGMVTVAYNSPRGIKFKLGLEEIEIKGNCSHLIGKEKGIISVGKYGYTRLEAHKWTEIEKVYGSMDIFKNGLIYAEKSKERAEEKAEDQAETRHGLEPVDPEKTHSSEAIVGA